MAQSNCSKCGKKKDYTRPGSGRIECRSCKDAYSRDYRNKPQAKTVQREYMREYCATPEARAARDVYACRPEARLAQREYMAVYRTLPEIKSKLRVYAREYRKKRYENDINFNLTTKIRSRLCSAIQENQKAGSAVRDLGCTVEDLRHHLESKFLPAGVYAGVARPAMSWENRGLRGWHIDHIKPLASFDLTDRQQFLQAVHYTNLQPLWAEQNLQKSDVNV